VPATHQAIALTRLAAEAAASKKGGDLVAFDVSEQLGITDVFLIVTATNERQVGAVVDAVEERLLGQATKPLRREGGRENRWVLLDYGDVLIQTAAADKGITFSTVAHPQQVQRLIFQKMDERRRRQEERALGQRQRELIEGLKMYDEMLEERNAGRI